MNDLLDGVTPLPEEEEVVFSSSGASFEVKSEDGHPVLKAIGIFLILVCGLGLANGLDFITPDAGLVGPHEWINGLAKAAPYDSATFTGTVESEGEPVEGAQVSISIRYSSNLIGHVDTVTDSEGKFRFENVTPGLQNINIIRWNDGNEHDSVQHRIILNPPTVLEPVGFSHIDFEMESVEHYSTLECEDNGNNTCIREVNHHAEEMEFPLMDESAAGMYVMVGWGMIGLSIIALGFTLVGLRNGSRGMIQTASVLVFFTAGHYYSACLFSLMAFALTFAVPRKSVILDA